MTFKASMLLTATCIFLPCAAGISQAIESCGPITPAEEQTLKLQQENSFLSARIAALESRRGITEERLLQKKIQLLKEIATDTKLQRQSMESLQGFVNWMSQNLAGYNKYIKAGSYAAVIGRILPVPYAGQASVFTKFAAQFTVVLNNTSVAMSSYLATSQKFTTMVDSIDSSKPLDQRALAEAASFAGTTLVKDTNDVQTNLSTVSELSSSALSFLESLNHYMSSTDEYWNKAKGFFSKDVDPKEKSVLSESTTALKNKAAAFNIKLGGFEDHTRSLNSRITSLAVYDELLSELACKQELH